MDRVFGSLCVIRDADEFGEVFEAAQDVFAHAKTEEKGGVRWFFKKAYVAPTAGTASVLFTSTLDPDDEGDVLSIAATCTDGVWDVSTQKKVGPGGDEVA